MPADDHAGDVLGSHDSHEGFDDSTPRHVSRQSRRASAGARLTGLMSASGAANTSGPAPADPIRRTPDAGAGSSAAFGATPAVHASSGPGSGPGASGAGAAGASSAGLAAGAAGASSATGAAAGAAAGLFRSRERDPEASTRAFDTQPAPRSRREALTRREARGQREARDHQVGYDDDAFAGASPAPRTRREAAAADHHVPEAARHSRRNDAFSRIVGWTSLGTLIPGLGMIKGRNSKLGWLLTLGFLLGTAAVIGWALYRGPVKVGARIISSPTILNTIAVALIIAAIVWAFVIIRSYVLLRGDAYLRRSQRALGSVLVVSLIVLTAVPMGIGASYARVQGETVRKVFGDSGGAVLDSTDLWKDKPRVNVFLIGRDNGADRQGTRPDTMLVASIDTHSGKTTLISVPRNLAFAHFPKGTKLAKRFPQGFNAFGPQESLINAVWTWAESEPQSVDDPGDMEVGMFATMKAVEGSLGLKMDNWASVDMEGFKDVVNAIGGVKIDVERPIPMGGGKSLRGVKNKIFGWIDPGEQVLTGKKALWYVRSRDGSDNYDRMCRQQRMLKTTLEQVNPSEIALAYPKLAGSAERNVATDIPQQQLNAFVELAALMQKTQVKSAQINNDVVDTTNPDFDKLHAWVQDQINPKVESQKEKATGVGDSPAEKPSEKPEEKETGAPAAGIENDEGKCYPKDYKPGDPWPGYPGNSREQQ